MPVKQKAGKSTQKKASTQKSDQKTISVADLCREHEIDPRKGRAKLRKHGWSAEGKHYPDLVEGTARYKEAVEIITS